MGLTLKQWGGSNVSPIDDAQLYKHLEPLSGVITGLALTASGSNSINVAETVWEARAILSKVNFHRTALKTT